MNHLCFASVALLIFAQNAFAFVPLSKVQPSQITVKVHSHDRNNADEPNVSKSSSPFDFLDSCDQARRSALNSLTTTAGSMFFAGMGAIGKPQASKAVDDNDSFASIAARASLASKEVDKEATIAAVNIRKFEKTAYDFSLPVEGKAIPFADLIKQDFGGSSNNSEEAPTTTRVKAIIVCNIKQDDPVARKTIPELISLATKYGRGSDGALAVVACPTDQGYYEADTSVLIRLKLASEYGYGINPATVATDKVNLLGTGAHPFWRWLQSNCRTPAGLGRVEGNFEKFLIDGRTGLPVRRYPRKYSVLNMADDIEAVIAGKPLPPARANFMEEWRSAAAEADRDTYRFEKGLNVFDQ